MNFDILYDAHLGSIKYLWRNKGKPWNSAIDLETEIRRMVLDLPRYAALYNAYQITLANENAVWAIAAPVPVEMDEEEDENG